MNTEMIVRTEAFLKETFASSTYLQNNPTERDYRLEHSYRVANMAKAIADAEGFDVTCAVIAGLLHDIAYYEEMVSREDRMNHWTSQRRHRKALSGKPWSACRCGE